MGIQDLHKFLKETRGLDYQEKLPAKVFAGKRVAIDGNGWFHRYIHPVFLKVIAELEDPLQEIDRRKVINLFKYDTLSFIFFFLQHGITPVFVWDGEAPPEKMQTRAKRRSEKQKKIDKLNELKEILLRTPPFTRAPEVIAEYKSLLAYSARLSEEESSEMISLISAIGIPSITSKSEAEELCASLAYGGKVMGVVTTDGDAFALGIPIVITEKGKNPKTGEYFFKVSYSFKICESLGMTQSQFRDFCIMCGTDFNERIPRRGPSTNFKFLEKYNFDADKAMEENPQIDFTPLNFERTRELLTPRFPLVDDASITIDTSSALEHGRDVFSFYGILEMWEEYSSLLGIIQEKGCSSFSFEELQ